jgi:hypothetical protein
MSAQPKLSIGNQNRLKGISTSYPAAWWLGVMGIMLTISACGLGDQVSSTPDVPPPTATALSTASIEGTLWHDLCVNDSAQIEPLAGCVIDTATGSNIANGILESGEPGMPGVKIELGTGSCPSSGLADVMTSEGGRYAIEGLWPGEYCVSVKFGDSHQPASTVPGIWTYPKSGMQTIALEHGERRVDVNFGWDYLHIPALPASEPTPEPSPAPSCVDSADFIKDVTFPDGSRIDPGDSFSKIWRLRNNGSCTWTSDYDLVFYSGDRMSGYYAVSLRGDVEPGKIVDLSIKLVAPKSIGTYLGYWMVRNAEAGIFGIGEDGSSPFWVKILIDPEITEWRGEYFDNQKLDGDPVLIRNDKEIDFNWKDDAPSSSLPANNFSVRWTRQLKFDAATYRFSILVDDGARLWVDDRLVIDEWDEGSARTVSVDLAMSKGKHDLQLEFFEEAGRARIYLDLDKVTVDHDEDWIASYWFNRTMDSEWALVKTVDEVDFDWGSGSPALGIPDDDFSARWSRVVDFEPGIYRVYARADDGIRVELDGNRVIDEWHNSNASELYAAEISLSGPYQVDVEYFERRGAAKVSFWWEYLGAVNEPPVATADVYEAMENEVLIVPAPGVLSNDEDPDGGSLIASLVSGTSNGKIALDQDGSFVYLPNADFIGEDGFTYRISDGELASSIASVIVTVKSTNSPPIAYGDTFVVSQAEVLEVPAPGVLENDVDDDGQSLDALLETASSYGSLELLTDGSFRYIPEPDFTGEDQFTYRASDGESMSEVASVIIAVQPANSPPVAIDDFYEIDEDESLSVGAPGILENDFDPDDQPLQVLLEEEPLFGGLSLHEDGSFDYAPLVDFNGDDQFTYRLSDGVETSELATVQIKVLPVNDLPQAVEDSASGTMDQILEIFVLANDIGLGDGPLTLSVEILPSEGTIEIVEHRIFYIPKAAFSGEDGFDYVVTDQDGESSRASVFITVIPDLS